MKKDCDEKNRKTDEKKGTSISIQECLENLFTFCLLDHFLNLSNWIKE